jgi:glycolate oxidase iron-sulfur subunit
VRTTLQGSLAETAAGAIAESVLRACVHCGMCNAACPTYQMTGDELDGPRGRIYLMKQALEGEPAGRLTQLHLDRCLGCRACETACPSGVEYHRLLDVGRGVGAPTRPAGQRLARWAIRRLALSPRWLGFLFNLGRAVRFALPRPLRETIPPNVAAGVWPATDRPRRMLLLGGCAQSAAAGHFNAATARVFDHCGISLLESRGCCGAVSFHLDAGEEARALARRLIDAWTDALASGAEAIVVNASGCAAFIRDWPDLFAEEPAYAAKARRVVESLRDPVEVLGGLEISLGRRPPEPRIAVHDPCTLCNGPGLAGAPAALLRRLGYRLTPAADGRCCGSAGTYALLQPRFARRLRGAKLAALGAGDPATIYTGNIGCWMHLAAASPVPVRHWIEAVDDLIS